MYTLKKKSKDWKKTVIEKQDTVEFTVGDADEVNKHHERLKTEWTAQLKVCLATMENIRRHHPKIPKLPHSELIAAKMFYENDEMAKQIRPKLREVKNVMDKYAKERKTILKTFNWTDDEGTAK